MEAPKHKTNLSVDPEGEYESQPLQALENGVVDGKEEVRPHVARERHLEDGGRKLAVLTTRFYGCLKNLNSVLLWGICCCQGKYK